MMYQTTPAANGLTVPVLVNALHSPMDAGSAAAIVAEHLTDSLHHERLVTFDTDQLVDYRANRPTMVFENWRFTQYHEPEIAIDLIRTDDGKALLLLSGPEPDLRWNEFISEVIGLVGAFGVEHTITVHGIPMGVPHTRPVQLTVHGTQHQDTSGVVEIFGTVQLPAYVSGLLEYRLGQAGRKATGLAASVPHYLASNPYPPAAAALVTRLSQLTGLTLPVGELEAASAHMLSEIAEQTRDQSEVQAVVHALEKQYDSFVAAQPHLTAQPEEIHVPTADEIGAAAEAFLADLTARDDDGGPTAR